MVRTYQRMTPYSKEQQAVRRYAATVGARAIQRLQAEGLVTTAAFRHVAAGLTLDRALAQSPFVLEDVWEFSFGDWLSSYDPAFDSKKHTISFWADQHTEDEVLAALRRYVQEMNPKAVPV